MPNIALAIVGVRRGSLGRVFLLEVNDAHFGVSATAARPSILSNLITERADYAACLCEPHLMFAASGTRLSGARLQPLL